MFRPYFWVIFTWYTRLNINHLNRHAIHSNIAWVHFDRHYPILYVSYGQIVKYIYMYKCENMGKMYISVHLVCILFVYLIGLLFDLLFSLFKIIIQFILKY
jgi:hypothetical protein